MISTIIMVKHMILKVGIKHIKLVIKRIRLIMVVHLQLFMVIRRIRQQVIKRIRPIIRPTLLKEGVLIIFRLPNIRLFP